MSNIAVRKLNEGVDALETMTRFALATLALASGVYTYLGVRDLLDGSSTLVFSAAIIYSTAVSVGVYAFWTYMMRLFPHVIGGAARAALFGVMLLGCVMIVAMSSWLNAAALAGSAALEQHLAENLQDYTADLDQAHENALAAQSLLPDIQRASERFSRLAADERESGALTGSSGSGSVVQLLSQMSNQLAELETSIRDSRERVQALFEEGQARLGEMRGLVSGRGDIAPRADAFAENAVALAGVIAAMEQTSVAPSVKRAAEDLSLGFIAPVADGIADGLVARQDQVMETIRQSVAVQSQALSSAADEILANEPVAERRFVPLSSAEAVLQYARDFIPSWAGAISIDLLPAVLVLTLAVVHARLRDTAERIPYAERISAADLMAAMEVQRAMDARAARNVEPAPAPEAETAEEAAEPQETQEPAAPARTAVADDPDNVATFSQAGHRARKDAP